MEYSCRNAMTLMVLLTHKLVYCGTLWHNRTNFRLFPDGKLFTRRTPYVNTIQYYWRLIFRDGEFILSVTFLILIYLKDYQEESLYKFTSLQVCTNYGKNTWIQQIHSGLGKIHQSEDNMCLWWDQCQPPRIKNVLLINILGIERKRVSIYHLPLSDL